MAKKKEKAKIVCLQIKAGEANPSPPVGTALGPLGVNMVDFCKSFNDKTKAMEKGLIVTALITVYSDKTLSFVVKSSPAAVLLLKAAGLLKGSGIPGQTTVGKVTMAQVEAIAKDKMKDLTAVTLAAAVRTIIGTAKSMGIEVEDI